MNNATLLDGRGACATELLRDVRSLPPLPTVALRIMEVMADEFVEGNEIADIVSDDPTISARLISLANSAYFGLPTPVYNMREVVNRVLGADTVRTLALGLATQRMLDTRACPAFDVAGFWRRALYASHSCMQLCALDEELSAMDRSSAYLVGLCHELGLLALVSLEPEKLNTVLAGSLAERDAAINSEFGFSLPAATHALAQHWGLPETIVEVYCQQAALPDAPRGLNRLLQLAQNLNLRLTCGEAVDEAFVIECNTGVGFPADAAAIADLVTPSAGQAARLRHAETMLMAAPAGARV